MPERQLRVPRGPVFASPTPPPGRHDAVRLSAPRQEMVAPASIAPLPIQGKRGCNSALFPLRATAEPGTSLVACREMQRGKRQLDLGEPGYAAAANPTPRGFPETALPCSKAQIQGQSTPCLPGLTQARCSPPRHFAGMQEKKQMTSQVPPNPVPGTECDQAKQEASFGRPSQDPSGLRWHVRWDRTGRTLRDLHARCSRHGGWRARNEPPATPRASNAGASLGCSEATTASASHGLTLRCSARLQPPSPETQGLGSIRPAAPLPQDPAARCHHPALHAGRSGHTWGETAPTLGPRHAPGQPPAASQPRHHAPRPFSKETYPSTPQKWDRRRRPGVRGRRGLCCRGHPRADETGARQTPPPHPAGSCSGWMQGWRGSRRCTAASGRATISANATEGISASLPALNNAGRSVRLGKGRKLRADFNNLLEASSWLATAEAE
ncbi:uncharacterized protein LOC112548314 [Alligator sinensis]|uniref:Uncharacterized protein LOC112548314 n=1 Tax=Alligator sinensis TaxID=38654 RepID=A0A3Q0FQC1_ALLSI|nr:uncharacterized protein LOC112548314 [Alligator sinensis]